MAYPKTASIEKDISTYMVWLLMFQVILCVIGTLGYHIHRKSKTYRGAWYLLPDFDTGSEITQFFAFFLLFSNFVPISLYVTMKVGIALLPTPFFCP